MPGAQIAAMHFLQSAADVRLSSRKKTTECNVVARVFRVGIAARHACDTLPRNEIGRFGKASLVAGPVEANVQHVEGAIMEKDEWIVDGLAVKGARVG